MEASVEVVAEQVIEILADLEDRVEAVEVEKALLVALVLQDKEIVVVMLDHLHHHQALHQQEMLVEAVEELEPLEAMLQVQADHQVEMVEMEQLLL